MRKVLVFIMAMILGIVLGIASYCTYVLLGLWITSAIILACFAIWLYFDFRKKKRN